MSRLYLCKNKSKHNEQQRKIIDKGSVADRDPGSEIRNPVLFTPWIRDPGSGSMINFSGSRISDPGSKGYRYVFGEIFLRILVL
jgi:hypothetical protein